MMGCKKHIVRISPSSARWTELAGAAASPIGRWEANTRWGGGRERAAEKWRNKQEEEQKDPSRSSSILESTHL